MTDGPYAILRVKPLSWPAVAAMTRHGRRTGPGLDHIDKARSAKNRFGSDWSDDASNLRDCMQRVMQHYNATLRKNAPVGSHLLLTASACYFRPGRPNELGTWDQHRLDSWLNANLAWVRRRWPDQLAA